MTTFGYHSGRVARQVNGLARRQNRAGGFDGDGHFQVLAGADTPEHAARVVRLETLRRQRVAVHAAALGHAQPVDGADAGAAPRL